MSTDEWKRVRIIDIHPIDGHYYNKDAILNTVGDFYAEEPDKDDYPEGDWVMGSYEPDTPLQTVYDNEKIFKPFFFFYAVKVEELAQGRKEE